MSDSMDGSLGRRGRGEPDAAARVGGRVGEAQVDDDRVEEDDDGVGFDEFGVCVGRVGGDYGYEG